jgi:hypothetical protein
MNIHSILQAGAANQLGPVTVSKIYPPNPGAKNKFVLIEDSSGKGALKIWGAAMNTHFSEGQQITLVGSGPKGGLKTSEYNGKTSIDANDCRIEIGGQNQAQPPATSYQQPAAQPAGQLASGNTQRVRLTSPSDELDQRDLLILSKHSKISAKMTELLIAEGLPEEVVTQGAIRAPETYHLSWCGQKGLGDID